MWTLIFLLPAILLLIVGSIVIFVNIIDCKTVKDLSPKVGKVICPLGAGAHFKR